MTSPKTIAIIGAAMLLAATSRAHHAVQAQFDISELKSLTGVMTLVEMINPHPYFHLDVKGSEGTVEEWEIEAPALTVLRRVGLLKSMVAGATYTIEYYPSRNGENVGLMLAVTLPDGNRVVSHLRDPALAN